MWVKICGVTTPDAVEAALDAGASAVGFVFAPSPRRVSTERATQLAAPARGKAVCVAVTQHPTQAEVDAIVAEFKPDALQTDFDDLAALVLPRSLAVLPVLRAGGAEPRSLPSRALFEGQRSGAGVTADWTRARALSTRLELILAGGLHSLNVAAAIDQVRPFGVDVSSGVESAPGIKSVAKIRAFVSAVRGAQVEIRR